MKIGKRNERVRFERRSEVVDEFGTPRGQWSSVLETWAEFVPEPLTEKIAGGQMQSLSRGDVVVPRSEALAAVTPADRIVFTTGQNAGETANIESIIRPNRASITFRVTLGVAT